MVLVERFGGRWEVQIEIRRYSKEMNSRWFGNVTIVVACKRT